MKVMKFITSILLIMLISVVFVGIVSAATDDPKNGDNIIIYQNGAVKADTMYYLLKDGFAVSSVTSDSSGTIVGTSIDTGMYCNKTVKDATSGTFSLNYPKLTANVYLKGTGISLSNSTVTKAQHIDIVVNSNGNVLFGLEFTTPSGGVTNLINGTDYSNVTDANTLKNIDVSAMSDGKWSVKATYLTGDTIGKLSIYTDSKYINSNVIAFTVGEVANTASINSDKIVKGDSVLLTIEGKPATIVEVTVADKAFYLLDGQPNVQTGIVGFVTRFNVTIPDSSSVKVQLYTNTTSETGSFTFHVKSPEKTINLKCNIENGKITIVTKPVYPVGEKIVLSGTNTESGNVYVFISGTNIDNEYLNTVSVDSKKTWKDEFYLPNKYDTGSYTIKVVSTVANVLSPVFDSKNTYEIASLTLENPAFSIKTVKDIVVKGEKTSITGTATGATNVMYYIFGSNTFITGTVEVDNNKYSIEAVTDNLDPGRYHVIIQHPMLDGSFNVGANQTTGDVKLNTAGDYKTGTLQFNVLAMQTGNAETALCALIDDINVDDICLKTTFAVINPAFAVNTVKNIEFGESFVFSGTTNLPVGDTVTIQVSSIAFGTNTSINTMKVVKIVAGENVNTWSATFDNLPIGDYNAVAKVTERPTYSGSGTFSVVAITPTEVPTANPTANPTSTTIPTQSPGFGALIALIGLGLVSVMVMRRN